MSATIHLDISKWIDISRNQEIAECFREALRKRGLVPALSLIHAFELARPKQEATRRGVTSFIDGIVSDHGVLWARLRHDIELDEARAELHRQINIEYTRLPVFCGTLPDSISHELEGVALDDWRSWSIEEQVEHLHRSPSYDHLYRSFRSQEHPAFLSSDYSLRHPADIALLFLPSVLRTPAGIIFQIDREGFRRDFDVSQCPVTELTFAYKSSWKKGACADPNDLEDLFYLVSVAYSDVAFVDGETRDLMRQAGIPNDRLPFANGDLKRWVDDVLASSQE